MATTHLAALEGWARRYPPMHLEVAVALETTAARIMAVVVVAAAVPVSSRRQILPISAATSRRPERPDSRTVNDGPPNGAMARWLGRSCGGCRCQRISTGAVAWAMAVAALVVQPYEGAASRTAWGRGVPAVTQ